MRRIILAASLVAACLFGGTANAMPIGSVAVPAKPAAEKVDWACGRGYHLNRWGDCRPNRWSPPPPPRYSHRWDRRDRWDYRGPPRREWRDHRDWRDRRDWR
nr:hypothetical protein [Rhizobium sp. CF080]